MERTRPFFHDTGRGFELRGTHLARRRPHVLKCPSAIGYGWWVAVYRGKASFDSSPSKAATKVIRLVELRQPGPGEICMPMDQWSFNCQGQAVLR